MKKSSNLRIAWLTAPGTRFNTPGALMYWKPVFREFQKIFPDTIFFTSVGIDPSYKKMFNVRSVGRFRWIRTKRSHSGYSLGFNFISPAIAFELQKLKPQLVISSGFNLWTFLAALLKHVGQWKLIILLDGSSPSIDCRDSPIRLFIRKWIIKRSDAFIPNSKKAMHYSKDYLGVAKKKIFHINYLTSDVKTLSKKSFVTLRIYGGQRPRFLYVGNLASRKGINYLLNAWSKLQELSPTPGSLWIVGDGRQKKELVQQTRTLGLKNVNFVGLVENVQLGSWYKSCDIFVFPTLEDIWGLVVPEAMVFGKPIICSKYAGASELVQHKKNGFIFEPKDPDELVKFMMKFIKSPDLAKKLGQKSKKIMTSYTYADVMANFQKVIKHVLRHSSLEKGNTDK